MKYNSRRQKTCWIIELCVVIGALYMLQSHFPEGKEVLPYSVKLFVTIAITIISTLLFLSIGKRIKKRGQRCTYLSSTIKMIDQFSGEEFEEYLKAHFENLGYKVQLTSKSNDYGVDLICTKLNTKIAIQAKRYKGRVGIAAVQQTIGGMVYYGCSTGMVVTNSYFTADAWKLAKSSNVTLWDRSKISKQFCAKDRQI